jgi:hypothetical protein
MLYYKNSNPEKNIGKSGKHFVVGVKIETYLLREDGSSEMVHEDIHAILDLMAFEDGTRTGECVKVNQIDTISQYLQLKN